MPLLQSTSDTIAVSLEQLQARTWHVPTLVIVLTLVLVTLGTLSLGSRFAIERSRPAILSAIYVFACVLVISMVVDYDRPDTGFAQGQLDSARAAQIDATRTVGTADVKKLVEMQGESASSSNLVSPEEPFPPQGDRRLAVTSMLLYRREEHTQIDRKDGTHD